MYLTYSKGVINMTVVFTNEELTAIANSKQNSRLSTIIYLEQGLSYYSDDEKDTKEFVLSLIDKLKAMTDKQYDGLSFDSVIDTTETEEM